MRRAKVCPAANDAKASAYGITFGNLSAEPPEMMALGEMLWVAGVFLEPLLSTRKF